MLVTGGSGFIGGHVVDVLHRLGVQVTSFDLVRPNRELTGVRYVKGDIRDTSLLLSSMGESRLIVHLAGISDISRCEDSPAVSDEVNLKANRDLISAIPRVLRNRQTPLKVVFASSAAVYGVDSLSSYCESAVLGSTTSLYGQQKLESERVFLTRTQPSDGFSSVCLRLFNVYGPSSFGGAKSRSVVQRFSTAVSDHQSFTISGTGEQVRDFIYVSDVVSAILKVGFNHSNVNQLFNVGTGKGTSINALADLFGALSAEPFERHYTPSIACGAFRSVADTQLIRESINWKADYDLSDGVSAVLSDSFAGTRSSFTVSSNSYPNNRMSRP